MLAFGYVNSTTPALLSSTSLASVTLLPSFVSTSSPKLPRAIVSPTLGEIAPADGFAVLPFGARALSLFLAFFGAACLGGGSSRTGRLRSSTMVSRGSVGEGNAE